MRDVLILKPRVTFVHACLQDDFYDAVYRYYPDGAEEFCTKLVMTFHEVNMLNTRLSEQLCAITISTPFSYVN